MNDNRGIVTVSKRAVEELAAGVTLRCEGTAQLCDRSRKDEFARILHGGRDIKGVYLSKGILDVYIHCKASASAVKTADTVAKNIKEAVTFIGVKLKKINVYVTGTKG